MPVIYDAVGAGATASASFNFNLGTSWSHTATGNFVIVNFTQYTNGTSPVGQTFSCTYNGINMTLLTRLDWDPAVSTSIYYMLYPPKGAQTVAVSVSSGTQTGRTVQGNSVSYAGVGGVLLAGTNAGSGGISTLSGLTTTANDLFFVTGAGWGGQSANSFTARSSILNSTYPQISLVVGDMPTTSTSASTTPANNPFTSWGILGVRLLGTGPFFGMF